MISTTATPLDPLSARLELLYTAALHDVLRAQGVERCVLPSHLRPLDPDCKLAGKVWTVSGHIDHTRSAHDTLLAWTGLLSQAPAGTVIVCQPNNHSVALMGELSARALQLKGVLGYIVDGGCRDCDFILALGFPVWCVFYTPSDITGRWVPDSFGAPVTLGEVTVCSGDYLLADRDGVVVIPQAMAQDVVQRTEQVALTESAVRNAILDGMDPQQAYLRFGKF